MGRERMRVGDQLEYGENHHGQSGAAHSINNDAPEENEAVRQLRAVVEEITGRPVEVPPARRIGFY